MISPFKFLLANQLKRPRQQQKPSGFTLIELLVAVILAFLILTPLLGFMVNIMETDRKEQAKASSEQELKAALDYMAEDLRQAIYIYDADGLATISKQLPPEGLPDKEKAGCSNAATCQPVLVFWKRENKPNIVPPKKGDTCTTTPGSCDDTFVYSLVGYYLITGNNVNNIWSNVYRIARFEISGGVSNPFDAINPLVPSDAGFNPLENVLQTGTGSLSERMKGWMKNGDYDIKFNFANNVLIDYIDKPIGTPPPVPSGIECGTLSRVPSPTINNFYACVGADNTYARIYIRGNALARLQKNNTYNPRQAAFFPTATIQVEGNGSLLIQ